MASLRKRDQHTSLIAWIRFFYKQSFIEKTANFGRDMRLRQTDVIGKILDRHAVSFLAVRHTHQDGELASGQTEMPAKYFTTREKVLQPENHLIDDVTEAFVCPVDDQIAP